MGVLNSSGLHATFPPRSKSPSERKSRAEKQGTGRGAGTLRTVHRVSSQPALMADGQVCRVQGTTHISSAAPGCSLSTRLAHSRRRSGMCNSMVSKEKSRPQLSLLWLNQHWENPRGQSLRHTPFSSSRLSPGVHTVKLTTFCTLYCTDCTVGHHTQAQGGPVSSISLT